MSFKAKFFGVILASFMSATAAAAPVIVPKAPDVQASSYILIDAKTGRVLTESNADEQLPPASLTKMMTSYIVSKEIEEGRMSDDDQVPISVKAWRTQGSKMFVREGTSVSMLELLKGLIIVSGNDATVALAEYVAGSEDSFVDVMNQQAVQLGLSDTQYVNSTGLPGRGTDNLTTARDLATLAQHLIYDYPEHYDLYKVRSYTYTPPGEKPIRQPNRNLLLGRDSSVDGLKTGYTKAAGYCLVASAERKGTRLISVVMGTKSPNARANESADLLQWGFRYFESKDALTAGQILDTVEVWKSTIATVDLTVPDTLTLTLNRGSFDELSYDAIIDPKLVAPLAAGTKVGTVNVMLGDEVVGTSDIVVATDVPEAGFFKRLWDSLVMFFMGLFK